MTSSSNKIRGEQRRRLLLQVGRKVLIEKGATELKISDIVKAADMAQGTFYNYFRDKEGFMVDFVSELMLPYRIFMRDKRANSETAYEFARNNFETALEVCLNDKQMCELLNKPINDFREYFYDPKVIGPMMEDMTEDLENGIAKGLFRPHAVERLSRISITMLMDLLNMAARNHDLARRIMETDVQLFASYIAIQETPQEAA